VAFGSSTLIDLEVDDSIDLLKISGLCLDEDLIAER